MEDLMGKKLVSLMPLLIPFIIWGSAFGEDETFSYYQANDPIPAGRICHTAIFDMAHQRMVIYGGSDENQTTLGDIWAFDEITLEWTELHAGNSGPNVLRSHAAIYDPVDTAMVVFGGVTYPGGNIINEVWILNLNTLLWENISHSNPWPPPTRCMYALFNPTYRQMIIYGGREFQRYEDTWIFDLAERGWHHFGYDGSRPMAREGALVALINEGNALLVYGGYNPGPEYMDELWTLDLTSGIWTQHHPDQPHPTARGYSPSIYDEKHSRILFFGGFSAYEGPGLNDLWEINLGSMQYNQLIPAGDIPSPRGRFTVVTQNFANHKAVIFGGADRYQSYYEDVYFLDWELLTSINDPAELPVAVELLDCYPNPFNAQTVITYSLLKIGDVRLKIYNLLGQRVAVLVNENQNAGSYNISWDAADLPSGIYFARLETDSGIKNIKMTLLK